MEKDREQVLSVFLENARQIRGERKANSPATDADVWLIRKEKEKDNEHGERAKDEVLFGSRQHRMHGSAMHAVLLWLSCTVRRDSALRWPLYTILLDVRSSSLSRCWMRNTLVNAGLLSQRRDTQQWIQNFELCQQGKTPISGNVLACAGTDPESSDAGA
jgi:hypothetical protein